MTKRILILLFAVLLTGMSEDVDSDCSDDGGYYARGGDYGHGNKLPPFKLPPRIGVYGDSDTDNCVWMNSPDALDPVDQESSEEY